MTSWIWGFIPSIPPRLLDSLSSLICTCWRRASYSAAKRRHNFQWIFNLRTSHCSSNQTACEVNGGTSQDLDSQRLHLNLNPKIWENVSFSNSNNPISIRIRVKFCLNIKLGRAGDIFGGYLSLDGANVPCISGHNQFTNKKFTIPCLLPTFRTLLRNDIRRWGLEGPLPLSPRLSKLSPSFSYFPLLLRRSSADARGHLILSLRHFCSSERAGEGEHSVNTAGNERLAVERHLGLNSRVVANPITTARGSVSNSFAFHFVIMQTS